MSTITDIFREHGITVAITAPLLQIQELALAVTLRGPVKVTAAYYALDHLVAVTVNEREAGTGIWRTRGSMTAALPTCDSDERQRLLASADLGRIVAALEELLEEGQSS